MRITIFGTGYVGLVQGACMADLGHDVLCIDIDKEKIKKLNNNQIPFYEPGLEDLVKRNKKQNRLKFSTNAKDGVDFGKVIFTAVNTPQSPNGQADLSAVFKVTETIAKNMKEYKVIVNKSTVPPGTGKKVREIIENSQDKISFSVVSNPEFLREGCAVKDFLIPDRIIIGIEKNDYKAKEIMLKIYDSLVRADKPIIFTNITTAEMIKYAANAMLATRISFMNELSYLAEKIGADIKTIAKGVGLDSRIGPRFLQAGCGYGGSCFPKDVQALIYEMKQKNIDSKILESVENVNIRQKQLIIKKANQLTPNLKNKTIGIWGLAFKPNTDDVRDAPAEIIINDLLKQNAKMKTFDPEAMSNFSKKYPNPNIEYMKNAYEAAKNTDLLILITEWNVFKEIDMAKVKNLMKTPNLLDCRNIYHPDEMRNIGFNYISIGRP